MGISNTLVLGASGATGRQLVEQLLEMGQRVRVIVRSPEKLPESWKNNDRVETIEGSISELGGEAMAKHVAGCGAVASCLGHNLTWKGIYGKPRRLVTDAVRLLCESIKKNSPQEPVKFVLMNTAGNSIREFGERISFGEKLVIMLLRWLLPPHTDNERAADYLRLHVGQDDPSIAWVVVRPDTLIDEDQVTAYTLHPSPVQSALFNPGKTSRINVAHCMATLMVDQNIWLRWKGQMPVVYNKTA